MCLCMYLYCYYYYHTVIHGHTQVHVHYYISIQLDYTQCTQNANYTYHTSLYINRSRTCRQICTVHALITYNHCTNQSSILSENESVSYHGLYCQDVYNHILWGVWFEGGGGGGGMWSPITPEPYTGYYIYVL